MFSSDKQRAFREAYRVLRRDGSLLFNTWDKLELNEAAHLGRRFYRCRGLFRRRPRTPSEAGPDLVQDSSVREPARRSGVTGAGAHETQSGVGRHGSHRMSRRTRRLQVGRRGRREDRAGTGSSRAVVRRDKAPPGERGAGEVPGPDASEGRRHTVRAWPCLYGRRHEGWPPAQDLQPVRADH